MDQTLLANAILNSDVAHAFLDSWSTEQLLTGKVSGRTFKLTLDLAGEAWDNQNNVVASIYFKSDDSIDTLADGSVWKSEKLTPQISFVTYNVPSPLIDDVMRFFGQIATLSQELNNLCADREVTCIFTAEEAVVAQAQRLEVQKENRKSAALREIVKAGAKNLRTGGNAKLVDRPSVDDLPNGTYIQNSYWDGKATHTYKIEVVDDGAFIRRIQTP